MEYFRFIDRKTTEEEIQAKIGPENISDFAETMLFLTAEDNFFNGVTLWGEFKMFLYTQNPKTNITQPSDTAHRGVIYLARF